MQRVTQKLLHSGNNADSNPPSSTELHATVHIAVPPAVRDLPDVQQFRLFAQLAMQRTTGCHHRSCKPRQMAKMGMRLSSAALLTPCSEDHARDRRQAHRRFHI